MADRGASRPASMRVSARRSIEVEPTLADAQAEQVEEGLLQPLVEQGLERLQIHRRGVQARAEGRRGGARRPRCCHAGPAPRAHHGEALVLLDEGRHLRQLDVLVHADRIGRQSGHAVVRRSTTVSGSSATMRLWPSWPGLAPPGRGCSRRSLRSVEGGLDDVRDVLAGRCSFSTTSIGSSLLRRSRSPRLMPSRNQPPADRASHRCSSTTLARHPSLQDI